MQGIQFLCFMQCYFPPVTTISFSRSFRNLPQELKKPTSKSVFPRLLITVSSRETVCNSYSALDNFVVLISKEVVGGVALPFPYLSGSFRNLTSKSIFPRLLIMDSSKCTLYNSCASQPTCSETGSCPPEPYSISFMATRFFATSSRH